MVVGKYEDILRRTTTNYVPLGVIWTLPHGCGIVSEDAAAAERRPAADCHAVEVRVQECEERQADQLCHQ